MRVKEIHNISNECVDIDQGKGVVSRLSPGSKINNICVENVEDIRDKVNLTYDLGEVSESSGRQRLDD